MASSLKSKVMGRVSILKGDAERFVGRNKPFYEYASSKILFDARETAQLFLGGKKHQPSKTDLLNLNSILRSEDVGEPRLRAFTGINEEGDPFVILCVPS